MHIADYIAIGFLIACMFGSAALVLAGNRRLTSSLARSTDQGGGKRRGEALS
jgi:hypothetical protein